MLDLRQAARALGGDIAGRDQAIRDLAWWAGEAERNGSDWRGVLLTVLRSLGVIDPCPICECEPCPTPSFCQLAREADRNRERERQQHRKLSPRSTPQMTVEAVKQAVRDGGLGALKQSATRERLSRCDHAARAEMDRWLSRFKRKEAA